MQLFIKCLSLFSSSVASSALPERTASSALHERDASSEKGASVQQARASSFCRENHRPIRRWFDSPRSQQAIEFSERDSPAKRRFPQSKIRRPPSTSPAPNRSSVTVSAKAGVQRAASPWNPPWKGGLRGIDQFRSF